jgi:hypothetical protein
VLKLRGDLFTSGRSKFADQAADRREPTAKVYVRVRFEGLERLIMAQVDTGAPWSVLAPDIADELGLLGQPGGRTRLRTSFGIKDGILLRIPLKLMADEGESLDVDGSFFVTPDWPEGLTFLGYSGLLDSIRFALDPQVNDFYFGPC